MSQGLARDNALATLFGASLFATVVLLQGACQSPKRSDDLASHSKAAPSVASSKSEPEPEKAPPHRVTGADLMRAPFKPVGSIDDLDPAVRVALKQQLKEPIAGAGEPFEATDVIMNDLPSRRFVTAGVSTLRPWLWLLCYEHGGVGYHYHIAVFGIKDGVASVLKQDQWMPKPGTPVTLQRVAEATLAEARPGMPQLDGHW